MPKVYGYIRVSTTDQENSDQVQLSWIKEMQADVCEKLGIDPGAIGIDFGRSGKIAFLDRKEARAIHAMLCTGDILIIYRLDRAFRNFMDTFRMCDLWEKSGIDVRFVHSPFGSVSMTSAMGRLLMAVNAYSAQWESEQISVRVKETAKWLKSQDRPTGGAAPWGKEVRKRIIKGKERCYFVKNAEQRKLGAYIVELHASGMSFARMYWHFFDQGIRNSQGGEYDPRRLWDLHKKELACRAAEAAEKSCDEAG